MWMMSRSCSSRPTLDLLGVVIGMIEISNLIMEYSGKRVVDIQSLQVDPGELFGFLGPNGAGKTTTIRILTTLTKPTSGRALINGSDVVRDLSKVKLEFGIVQQHLSLNKEHLSLHIIQPWSPYYFFGRLRATASWSSGYNVENYQENEDKQLHFLDLCSHFLFYMPV